MKNLKLIATAIFTSILFISCSDDDDGAIVIPEPIHEEEVITTITVTLTPNGGGTAVTLQSQDLDGDGPNAPTISVSGDLTAGVTYDGAIVLLNETESPADDITVEVEEESNDHQFFYTANGGLDVTTAYANFDDNGDDLGTEFSLTANTATTGTLTFTLRHEPTKPNTGLADAGGETDISATFDVTIQ